jgi:transcriptional regulator with GAF, ATPase, and Fis domain
MTAKNRGICWLCYLMDWEGKPKAMSNDRQSLSREVWRIVGKHLDLQETVHATVDLLRASVPLVSIEILELDDRAVQLIATSIPGKRVRQPIPIKSQWSGKLLPWIRSGHLWQSDASLASELPLDMLLGDGIAERTRPDRTLAGPMLLEGRHGSWAILSWRHSAGQNEVELATALLEPLSVAVLNDVRLAEIKRLKAAAEADRTSLLSRLGRSQVHEVEVVGANRGLRQVFERIDLIAESDLPVLILGETGTGKEVVSRAIHLKSRRSAAPFIRVNCGAIPSELIDSQLFGHEKGSFTGAVDQHQGWFERADGGTLFLDEIGELPLAAQVRLLRVLQDHQVERVGGRQPISVDVRIIAATHRDLAAMVKSRSFREDLWYRINVFPILLPRLQDRKEDLPELVRHFLQKASTRFGLPMVEPTARDLELLSDYPWPGNIRELHAVIDRAAILGNGSSLEVAKALGIANEFGGRPISSSELHPTLQGNLTDRTLDSQVNLPTLDQAMKAHIEQALAVTQGRIEGDRGAAKLLDINPHTLRARMRKLGIRWSAFRQ